jgi:hypothetical protein
VKMGAISPETFNSYPPNHKAFRFSEDSKLHSPVTIMCLNFYCRNSFPYYELQYPDRLCGLVVRIVATDPDVPVRFPALPDSLSSESGTGTTQPREYN